MKKKIISLVAVLLLSFVGMTAVQAERGHHEKPEFNEVELTEKQQEELRIMYEDLVNQHKGIIGKYVEFGALSEEDADKMYDHLDRFIEKLEADEFILKKEKNKEGN